MMFNFEGIPSERREKSKERREDLFTVYRSHLHSKKMGA